MEEVMSLQEAARYMECKDTRPVRKFCEKYKVRIFHRPGSKKSFLWKMEFETIYEKSLVTDDGICLYDYAKSVMNGLPQDSEAALTESKTPQRKKHAEEKYKPKGKHEKEFLSMLSKELSNTD